MVRFGSVRVGAYACASSGKWFERWCICDVEHSRMTIICILNLFSFFDRMRLNLMGINCSASYMKLHIMSWVHRMNKRYMFSSVYTSVVCEVIERVLHVIYILHASITTWSIHIDCIWFTDPFLICKTRNHDDVLHQFVFVFWFCMCERAKRAFAKGQHSHLPLLYVLDHARYRLVCTHFLNL